MGQEVIGPCKCGTKNPTIYAIESPAREGGIWKIACEVCNNNMVLAYRHKMHIRYSDKPVVKLQLISKWNGKVGM